MQQSLLGEASVKDRQRTHRPVAVAVVCGCVSVAMIVCTSQGAASPRGDASVLAEGCQPREMHTNMNGQYTGRDAISEDCEQLCHEKGKWQERSWCEYITFSSSHGGTCKLYDCNPLAERKTKPKTVLLVIDMQEDYRNQSGIPQSMQAINSLKDLRTGDGSSFFDLTVYTQDWLPASAGFAAKYSEGAKIMKEIAPSPRENHWIFTKDTDDCMTVLDAATATAQQTDAVAKTYSFQGLNVTTRVSFDGKRHFSIDPEHEGLDNPIPLVARLAEHGYLPSTTHIYAVGTQENRCVMKSALHAKQFGFHVVALIQAQAGGQLEKWKEKHCPDGIEKCDFGGSFEVPVPDCEHAAGEQKCDKEELRKWREAVYMGYHGGPAMTETEHYLSTGGVKVVSPA